MQRFGVSGLEAKVLCGDAGFVLPALVKARRGLFSGDARRTICSARIRSKNQFGRRSVLRVSALRICSADPGTGFVCAGQGLSESAVGLIALFLVENGRDGAVVCASEGGVGLFVPVVSQMVRASELEVVEFVEDGLRVRSCLVVLLEDRAVVFGGQVERDLGKLWIGEAVELLRGNAGEALQCGRGVVVEALVAAHFDVSAAGDGAGEGFGDAVGQGVGGGGPQNEKGHGVGVGFLVGGVQFFGDLVVGGEFGEGGVERVGVEMFGQRFGEVFCFGEACFKLVGASVGIVMGKLMEDDVFGDELVFLGFGHGNV